MAKKAKKVEEKIIKAIEEETVESSSKKHETKDAPLYWCVAVMQGVPGFGKGLKYPVIDLDDEEAVVSQNGTLVMIPIKQFNIMFRRVE